MQMKYEDAITDTAFKSGVKEYTLYMDAYHNLAFRRELSAFLITYDNTYERNK